MKTKTRTELYLSRRKAFARPQVAFKDRKREASRKRCRGSRVNRTN